MTPEQWYALTPAQQAWHLQQMQPAVAVPAAVAMRNGYGITALVVGLVALLLAGLGGRGVIVGLPAIVALVFAGAGHRRCTRGVADNEKMCVAGMLAAMLAVAALIA